MKSSSAPTHSTSHSGSAAAVASAHQTSRPGLSETPETSGGSRCSTICVSTSNPRTSPAALSAISYSPTSFFPRITPSACSQLEV